MSRDDNWKVREEIDSHSSKVTNDRIGEIKSLLWQNGYDSLRDPVSADAAVGYFSSCCQLYSETWPMYDSEANKSFKDKIERWIVDGLKLLFKIRTNVVGGESVRPLLSDVKRLSMLSFQLQHAMNGGMQNLKYLFRIGKPDPKGIDSMLRLFESDKLWGGKGLDEEVDDEEVVVGV